MRTNEAGQPGSYQCDRCGGHCSSGCYTGFAGFPHVCGKCRAELRPCIKVADSRLCVPAGANAGTSVDVDTDQHAVAPMFEN